MAAALSNHTFSFAPPPPPATTRTTLKTLTLALPAHKNPSTKSPLLHLRTLSSSPQFPCRPFKASSPKVAEFDPTILNGEGSHSQDSTLDTTVNQNKMPTMKTLIQEYKKAILDEDEKSVCEMEAAICVMEKEKNDLSVKFSDITAEIAYGKDKCLCLVADFENFRKRSEKDRITFTSDIQGEVVESLLFMVDSFEKVKKQIRPETEKERKIDTSYQALYKQFVEIMRSLHVAVVETIGKPFDPSVHEAIGREESEKYKEGIVTQELRRGFVLGGRLLRPAKVKVSAGRARREAPSPSETLTEEPEEAIRSVEDAAPTASEH